MDKMTYLRHEGVKSLYKTLLNIFDCYGINSDSKGNLKAPWNS